MWLANVKIWTKLTPASAGYQILIYYQCYLGRIVIDYRVANFAVTIRDTLYVYKGQLPVLLGNIRLRINDQPSSVSVTS